MPDSGQPRYVFREDDHAIAVDRKGRRYLVQLRSSETFHTHVGNFPHSDVIGRVEGSRITTSRGHRLLVLKPSMAEFTRLMPRIATVVYPKDLGAIVVQGDIFPGASVLEAGVGSGALTIALLRAVGESGRVVSYDVRSDMIERARANVEAAVPHGYDLTLKIGDVYQGFEERELDRIVLDLPEPWRVVPHASETLVPGGVLLGFLPTVPQVSDPVRALRAERTFDMIETTELLERPWSIDARSVRPSHRMVGHTGFITAARRCEPAPRPADPAPPEDDGAAEAQEPVDAPD